MLIGLLIAILIIVVFIWYKQTVFEFVGIKQQTYGTWTPYSPQRAVGNELLKLTPTTNVNFGVYRKFDLLSTYMDNYYTFVYNKYGITKFLHNMMPLPDSPPTITNRTTFEAFDGTLMDFLNDLVPAFLIVAGVINSSPNFQMSPSQLENYNMVNPVDDKLNFWIAISIMVRWNYDTVKNGPFAGLLPPNPPTEVEISVMHPNSPSPITKNILKMDTITNWIGLDMTNLTQYNMVDYTHNNIFYSAACDYWKKIKNPTGIDNFTVYGISLKNIGAYFELDKCAQASSYQCTIDSNNIGDQLWMLKQETGAYNFDNTQTVLNRNNDPLVNTWCESVDSYTQECPNDPQDYNFYCDTLDFDNAQCAQDNRNMALTWMNEYDSRTVANLGGQAQADQTAAALCAQTMPIVNECGMNVYHANCDTMYPSMTCARASIGTWQAVKTNQWGYITNPYPVDDILSYCNIYNTTLDDDGKPCTNLNPMKIDCTRAQVMTDTQNLLNLYEMYKPDPIKNIGIGSYPIVCDAIADYLSKWANDPERAKVEHIIETMNCLSDRCQDYVSKDLYNADYMEGNPVPTDPYLISQDKAKYCGILYEAVEACDGADHPGAFPDKYNCDNQPLACITGPLEMSTKSNWYLHGQSNAAPNTTQPNRQYLEDYCNAYNASVAAGCTNTSADILGCTNIDKTFDKSTLDYNNWEVQQQLAMPSSAGQSVNWATETVYNNDPKQLALKYTQPLSLRNNVCNEYNTWKTTYSASDPAYEAECKEISRIQTMDYLNGYKGMYLAAMNEFEDDYQAIVNAQYWYPSSAPGAALDYGVQSKTAPGSGGNPGYCNYYNTSYKPVFGSLAEYDQDCGVNVGVDLHALHMKRIPWKDDQNKFQLATTNSGLPDPGYIYTDLDAFCTYYHGVYKPAMGADADAESDCNNETCLKITDSVKYAVSQNADGENIISAYNNQYTTYNTPSQWDIPAQAIKNACATYNNAAVAGCNYTNSDLDGICPNIDQRIDLHPVDTARYLYMQALPNINSGINVAALYTTYANAYGVYKGNWGPLQPYDTECANAACNAAKLQLTPLYNRWYANISSSAADPTTSSGIGFIANELQSDGPNFANAYTNVYIPACGHDATYDASLDLYNKYSVLVPMYNLYMQATMNGTAVDITSLSASPTYAQNWLTVMPKVCNMYTNSYKPTWGTLDPYETKCATWQHDGLYAQINGMYNNNQQQGAMNVYLTQYVPVYGTDSTWDPIFKQMAASNALNYINTQLSRNAALVELGNAQNSDYITQMSKSDPNIYNEIMSDFSSKVMGYYPYYQKNYVPNAGTLAAIESEYQQAKCFTDTQNVSNFKAQYDTKYANYSQGVSQGQYTQAQVNLYYMNSILKNMCPPYRDLKTNSCATLPNDSWYDQQCSSVGL